MSSILPQIDTVVGLILLIIGFGFIIFVHELGHFVVAKWVGIKCTQFAIGFGTSIVAWRKGIGFRVGSTESEYQKRLEKGADPGSLGDTEYRLNYVPLGGYVKMLGQEDMNPTAASSDPRSFTSKPVWARMCVISAGVVMNLIFAMVFFLFAFMAGVAFPPAVVGETAENSPAATTFALGHEGESEFMGLRSGDRITHVDGNPTLDFTDIKLAAALGREDRAIDLTIQRDSQSGPLTYIMTPQKQGGPFLQLGIAPPTSLGLSENPDLLPAILREAGVKSGMRIVSAGGEPIDSYDAYRRIVTGARGQPVEVTFADEDGSETTAASIHARPLLIESDQSLHLLGLAPATIVSNVSPGSPAETAGIKRGDVIAAVDDRPWPSIPEFIDQVRTAKGAVDVVVSRNGELVDMGEIKPRRRLIGITLSSVVDSTIVRKTLPGLPASALNLTSGSSIVSINGQSVSNFADMQRILQEELAKNPDASSIQVTARLNLADDPTETQQIPLAPQDAAAIRDAGWEQPLHLMAFEEPLIGNDPIDALVLGFKKTHQTMVATYVTLLRLVQGRVPLNEMRGPIGIADIGTQIARERGITYLIFFLGLISVNLAVINFLPIPVVDGGHMVFLIIEKVKGSPASTALQTAATIAGLALIGCIFLMVTFYDIVRFFQ